jgi:predicted DNA-binding transcriptional regulator AlpA
MTTNEGDRDRPRFLSIEEAAKRLDMHFVTAYRLIKDEKFPFDGTIEVLTVGSRMKVRSVEVERLLVSRTVSGNHEVA